MSAKDDKLFLILSNVVSMLGSQRSSYRLELGRLSSHGMQRDDAAEAAANEGYKLADDTVRFIESECAKAFLSLGRKSSDDKALDVKAIAAEVKRVLDNCEKALKLFGLRSDGTSKYMEGRIDACKFILSFIEQNS